MLQNRFSTAWSTNIGHEQKCSLNHAINQMSKITYTAYETELSQRLLSLLQEARQAIPDDRYDELEGTWLMGALDAVCDLEYELEH